MTNLIFLTYKEPLYISLVLLTVVHLFFILYYTFLEFNINTCSSTIVLVRKNINVLDEDDTGIPELFNENNHKTVDIPVKSNDETDYTGIPELFDENNHKTSNDETDYTGIPELFNENCDKNSSELIEWFLSQPVDKPIILPIDKIPIHDISVPRTCWDPIYLAYVPPRPSGWLEFNVATLREIRAPLPDGSTVRVWADGPIVLPQYWPDVCERSQHIHYPSYKMPPIEIIDHFKENGYVYDNSVGFIPDYFTLSDYLTWSIPGLMDHFIKLSEIHNNFAGHLIF